MGPMTKGLEWGYRMDGVDDGDDYEGTGDDVYRPSIYRWGWRSLMKGGGGKREKRSGLGVC